MNFFDPFEVAPMQAQDWSAVDRYLGLPNTARLWDIARHIDQLHGGQPDGTDSWRKAEHRFIGLYGERAFARIFELKMDFRFMKYGNARQNFRLRDGTVIDVVTRTWSNPLNPVIQPEMTIRHKGKGSKAKIMVLVYYCGGTYEPTIVGWMSEREAHEVGREDQFMEGIVNVVVPRGLLHDPVELLIKHKPESPWIRAHEERKQMVKDAIDKMREIENRKPVQAGLL